MSKQLAKRGGGRSDSTSLPAFCPSYCLFRSFPQKNIIIIIIIIIILLFRFVFQSSVPPVRTITETAKPARTVRKDHSKVVPDNCRVTHAQQEHGLWEAMLRNWRIVLVSFYFTPDQFDFRYCKLVKIPKQKGILTRTLKSIQNRPYYLIRNLV